MIRVASYNIRRGLGTDWRRSLRRCVAVLREVDADVVALQESDPDFTEHLEAEAAEAIEATTPYVPVRLQDRDDAVGWRGNMLLMREGMTAIRTASVALHSPEQPRGALVADVGAGGSTIRIVGLHLGLLGGWRVQQAFTLLQHLQLSAPQLPMIIMGDFNEWQEGGGALRQFLNDHEVAATGRSFHSRLPVASLDKIIHSRELQVLAAGVHRSPLARQASDHLPIWAHLDHRSARSEEC
jgi:endonuclease/exonuclease/phosphatase family metal-dependent hydrolase